MRAPDFGHEPRPGLRARLLQPLGALYARATARRLALEERVALMRDGTLERDMLDEQARRALNMSAADEITIMRPLGNLN